MFSSAFRIYLSANLLVYVFVAIFFFPEGLVAGLVALVFSCLISVPALLLLLFCFFLVHRYRPGVVASWTVLSITVLLCIILPFLLILPESWWSGSYFLFYVSAGAGLGATLLQSVYLHKQFKSLHHENN